MNYIPTLEEIGFEWNQKKSTWNERLEELKEYKAKNGHCNVPQRYETNKALGNWVSTQRSEYRLMLEGSKSWMTQERVEKLENIGFEWSLKKRTACKNATVKRHSKRQKWNFKLKKYESTWNERLEELKEYKDQHGHCNVLQRYETNKALGKWVHTQRQQYNLMSKGLKSHMTQERVEKLEEIGFEWNQTKSTWNERFEELKEYKDQHGHCNVPCCFETNKALGNWVHTQRKQYKLMSKGLKSYMTQERVEKLEEIGFEWNQYESTWNERFEELKEYKSQYGHCNVPSRYERNKVLAMWVVRQRSEYRLMSEGSKSDMTEERVEKLENIGFEWSLGIKNSAAQKNTWNERLEELKEYKSQYGNCNVPRCYERNKVLAMWVHTQRQQYSLMSKGLKSTMTQERIEKLEEIGFKWIQYERFWNERLEELKEYKSQHGHCNVPQSFEINKALGNWVSAQRQQYNLMSKGLKSHMTQERVEKLENIGFEWSLKKRTACKNATVKRHSKRLRSKKYR